eukprot:TRINITY_DN2162_c0_g5_i1.p7 TRINITY_DN2162_c0_g5~~TRINITY_DN2162_c0_g5_i1.p7  ORF type:complete len:112 (-),score=27.35 TRINITY_DN2162_c0_g5_i1:1-336(-)
MNPTNPTPSGTSNEPISTSHSTMCPWTNRPVLSTRRGTKQADGYVRNARYESTSCSRSIASARELTAGSSMTDAMGSVRPRTPVSYTHLRAHETPEHLVCRLLLEKKKKKK